MQPRIEGYSYDPLASHGQANCSGESRAKIARLIEWLTIASGVPGCMHGGGSPDGAKLVIAAHTDITRNINLAKRLAQITEDISVESKKKG
jgi:4-hydroxybutyryl-CoA dehydratase/vinylacetyl-CoA-Delta-isomerase